MIELIKPEWPAPAHVHACSTTRLGGISHSPFDSLNLGDHVGDNETHVEQNRKILREHLQLPSEPRWLEQIHGKEVLNLDHHHSNDIPKADGSYTKMPNHVCVIMTADCLPILLTNRAGNQVQALHGGWRGLASGIIEEGIRHFSDAPSELLAWLGPAIAQNHYEVGPEVRDQLIQQDPSAKSAFKPSPEGRWLADLYQLARQRLQSCGVTAIFGGDLDVYGDSKRFFSYRRDKNTGRMGSLIWFNQK